MSRRVNPMLVLLALLLPAAAPAAVEGKLVLTGASTIAPLASEIGKKFEGLHPGLRIDVQTGGSSRGVNDSRKGLNDIGMVSRDLSPDEKDLRAFTIARDGVCIILHGSNPVNGLTDDQVRGIYTGRIRRWKEVGGPDSPIVVVSKAEGRSTLELFLHFFKLKSPEIKAAVLVGDNEHDIKSVAGSPAAIGYVSIGSAEFSARSGVPIKLLPMGGVLPTSENVRAGKFPLSRPLNLVTRAEPRGQVQAFIEFARSKEVDPLVREQFFVPLAR